MSKRWELFRLRHDETSNDHHLRGVARLRRNRWRGLVLLRRRDRDRVRAGRIPMPSFRPRRPTVRGVDGHPGLLHSLVIQQAGDSDSTALRLPGTSVLHALPDLWSIRVRSLRASDHSGSTHELLERDLVQRSLPGTRLQQAHRDELRIHHPLRSVDSLARRAAAPNPRGVP